MASLATGAGGATRSGVREASAVEKGLQIQTRLHLLSSRSLHQSPAKDQLKLHALGSPRFSQQNTFLRQRRYAVCSFYSLIDLNLNTDSIGLC